MTLKIKDKKIIWTKLYFKQFYMTRKFKIQGSFVDIGSESGSGIFLDPDDPKRLDPTGSGSATLVVELLRLNTKVWDSKHRISVSCDQVLEI